MKNWMLAFFFFKEKSRILRKEKSIHQFSLDFIFSFEGSVYLLNDTNQSHPYWAPGYLVSLLLWEVRATRGVGDN
jgi:hypothetical protein